MRGLKTLFVVLVISCLALSSLMASPSTWAWLTSSQPSEASTMPEEALIPENETSETESESSVAISEVVEVKAEASGDEYVLIKRSDLEAVIEKMESSAAKNAKAKASVQEAKTTIEDSITPYVAPVQAKEPKLKYFMLGDFSYGFDKGIQAGASFGIIFKDCLVLKLGVMKDNGIKDWLVKENYVGTASIGIVF